MKNKILEDKILSSILDNTKSGNLKWTSTKSIFNSEKSHKYKCNLGNDSDVEITISLDENLGYTPTSLLRINNPKLTDGHEYCHSLYNDKVNIIGEQVFLKFVSPTLSPRTATQDSIIEGILNSISIEENRDRKIDEIIEPKKKKWSLF